MTEHVSADTAEFDENQNIFKSKYITKSCYLIMHTPKMAHYIIRCGALEPRDF